MTLFNNTSLFTSGQPKKEMFEPEDASLALIESFFTKEESDRLYENLLKETKWKTSQITIYGKLHDTPTLIAWHGDAGKNLYLFGKYQMQFSVDTQFFIHQTKSGQGSRRYL